MTETPRRKTSKAKEKAVDMIESQGIAMGTVPSAEFLLKFMKDNPKLANKRAIAKAFNLKGSAKIKLKHLLAELQDSGKLERGSRKQILTPNSPPPVVLLAYSHIDDEGTLFGFPVESVKTLPDAIPVFASKKSLAEIDSTSRFLTKITEDEDEGGYVGHIIKILPQKDVKRVYGVFKPASSADEPAVLEGINRKGHSHYSVAKNGEGSAKAGDLVAAIVVEQASHKQGVSIVKVESVLADDVKNPAMISFIAIHEHNIPMDFSEQALKDAENTPQLSVKGREDLRKIPLVTIDPSDARDHDDAVFAQYDTDPNNQGGFILWVAIADVAYYVKTSTGLDNDARTRGNSVYFPDRVVPMLPETLSAGLCSLHEGEDRACIALRIVLDSEGRKKGHQFVRGLMHSVASLTYEEVQSAFDGSPNTRTQALMEDVITPLGKCYEALTKMREQRQPLNLDTPEYRIHFDDKKNISDIRLRTRLETHRLIEECMVLANVCAAETLEKKKVPLLYRVHEPPSPEKVHHFKTVCKNLDLNFATREKVRPSGFNRILDHAKDTPNEQVMNLLVLRSQSQAVYSPRNQGHFGLNLERYAHFTSPIRRYADLVVHRALYEAHGWSEDYAFVEDKKELDELALHLCQTERRAVAAERDSFDRYLASYMKDRTGQEFQAQISGVSSSGLFVRLPEFGAEGFIPMRSLDGYFIFEEGKPELTDARTGSFYRLGEKLTVKLLEVAPLAGGLRFEPVGRTGLSKPTREGRLARGKGSQGKETPSRSSRRKPRKEEIVAKVKERLAKKSPLEIDKPFEKEAGKPAKGGFVRPSKEAFSAKEDERRRSKKDYTQDKPIRSMSGDEWDRPSASEGKTGTPDRKGRKGQTARKRK